MRGSVRTGRPGLLLLAATLAACTRQPPRVDVAPPRAEAPVVAAPGDAIPR